jgi:hypothetical protein
MAGGMAGAEGLVTLLSAEQAQQLFAVKIIFWSPTQLR